MKRHELSSLKLAASCPVNNDIQAEGDRANDCHAFYKKLYVPQRSYCKSHSVTAEGSWCCVATHINLLPDNTFPSWLTWVIFKRHISCCVMCGSKISFLSPAAAMLPYLEVCLWNAVIRTSGVCRWEQIPIDKSGTQTSHCSIYSPAKQHVSEGCTCLAIKSSSP